MYKSHQRWSSRWPPSWECWSAGCNRQASVKPPADEAFRNLLDRMISNTRDQFPAVSDLARELRYRYCDQPLFEEARRQIYARRKNTDISRCESECARAAREDARSDGVPAATGRSVRRPIHICDAPLQQLMLEVLIPRYYRHAELTNTAHLSHERILVRRCRVPGGRKVASCFCHTCGLQSLEAVSLSVAHFINQVPAEHDIVLDFYGLDPEPLGDAESISREIQPGSSSLAFRALLGESWWRSQARRRARASAACSTSPIDPGRTATRKRLLSWTSSHDGRASASMAAAEFQHRSPAVA